MESNVNITAFSGSVVPTNRSDVTSLDLNKVSAEDISKADRIELAQKSLQQENHDTKRLVEERVEEVQDKSSVEDVIESLNKIMEVQDRAVKFVVDERDGQFFTSVLNSSTDELIREIPTEEYRQLEERLKKFQDAIGETTGLFVDQLV